MAKVLQFRRGTTSGISTITGAEGELFVDLSKDTLIVMDGNTAGGQPLQKEITGSTNITAGIVTASSFSGNASSATALQTSRSISITGDVEGSVFFDGTSNVSIAATIQPNSVALGSDTTGDYVQSVSGTSNQITVTGGTGEGSTPTLSVPNQFTAPQDVTVTRDLQVNRNLNVNGNITIGGTSAFIAATELKVYDPDIVLGVRTDGSGNDISNDNTANHGGIAIASTEGSPLISLYDVGIGETNPATYKKIMWFKEGTFAGLGTDAWLSNYAVGIGSTQFPAGTRLAAGNVQFTENDLAVVRNINSSGISTFNGQINVKSTLKDVYGHVGTASSVLVSTGTGVRWEAISVAALQGAQGASGSAGAQGAQGALAGVPYNFSTSTTNSDPGSGFIRFNSSTLSSVGLIYVDYTDADGVDQIQWFAQIGYGVLSIYTTSGTLVASFNTTSWGTPSGYRQIYVSYLAGTSLPSNNQRLILQFSRTGFNGTNGAQGDQGASGSQGAQGASGASGSQGAQGSTGATGAQGSTGATGAQGSAGAQGSLGAQGSTGATGAQGSQGSAGASGAQGAIAPSDSFNTGISSNFSANLVGIGSTVITFPATSGKRYIIHSINAANVAVGFTEVNVIASIDFSGGEKTYIAYNVPIPTGTSIELLKEPQVLNPSDKILMRSTDSTRTAIDSAVQVYVSYQEVTNTSYFGVGIGSVGLGVTTPVGVYTATTYPSIIQSIRLANRTDDGPYPVTVSITSGLTTTNLVKDLIVPKYGVVELLEKPKRLDTSNIIKVQTPDAKSIDVTISGIQIV